MRKAVVYGSGAIAFVALIAGVFAYLNGSMLALTLAPMCFVFIVLAVFAQKLTIGP